MKLSVCVHEAHTRLTEQLKLRCVNRWFFFFFFHTDSGARETMQTRVNALERVAGTVYVGRWCRPCEKGEQVKALNESLIKVNAELRREMRAAGLG